MNHPMINMIVGVEILIIARVQAIVKPLDPPRVLPRPSNEHSKRAQRRMTRKYVEDYTALTICRTIESGDIFHPIDQLSFLC